MHTRYTLPLSLPLHTPPIQSAQRELEEELGITDAPLAHLFDILYEDDLSKVGVHFVLIPAQSRAWRRLFSLSGRDKGRERLSPPFRHA